MAVAVRDERRLHVLERRVGLLRPSSLSAAMSSRAGLSWHACQSAACSMVYPLVSERRVGQLGRHQARVPTDLSNVERTKVAIVWVDQTPSGRRSGCWRHRRERCERSTRGTWGHRLKVHGIPLQAGHPARLTPPLGHGEQHAERVSRLQVCGGTGRGRRSREAGPREPRDAGQHTPAEAQGCARICKPRLLQLAASGPAWATDGDFEAVPKPLIHRLPKFFLRCLYKDVTVSWERRR